VLAQQKNKTLFLTTTEAGSRGPKNSWQLLIANSSLALVLVSKTERHVTKGSGAILTHGSGIQDPGGVFSGSRISDPGS
jgi:hypothetical protein